VYPLENARVELIGGNYTFSDATGHYSIVVPAGERNILGRAIGYLNETETVTVSGNTNLNLTLSERKPVSVSAPGFEGIAGLFILVITIIFIKIRRNP
jgi:hypothetical protein